MGQLPLGLALLGHDALEHGGVNFFPVLCAGGMVGLLLLLVAGGPRGHVAGLGGNVAVVDGGSGEVMGDGLGMGLVVDGGLANAVVLRLGVVAGVDVGHVRRGLAVRRVGAGLLAVAQEVLEVLYCGHV